MDSPSIPESGATQSSPDGSNGGIPPNPPDGVLLSSDEWSDLVGCSMALHSAVGCESADDVEKLELVEAVNVRLNRLVSRIGERLPMPEVEE